jgi:hypothetical protein
VVHALKFTERAAWALELREGAELDLAAGRALEDADSIPVLERAVAVVHRRRGPEEGREREREDMEEEDGVPLSSWRADLSGEEGGEDEGGAPVGAGEEKWRQPLDLWREEVCSHGPCAADLRRERRGGGDGEGAGGDGRRRLRGGGGSGLGFGDLLYEANAISPIRSLMNGLKRLGSLGLNRPVTFLLCLTFSFFFFFISLQ